MLLPPPPPPLPGARQWLREASMNRLNANIKSKMNKILQPLASTKIDASDLEPSGLTTKDKYHICRWVNGTESGRSCMLAIFGNMQRDGDTTSKEEEWKPMADRPPIELSLLSSTINLPDNFLCNSGFIYDRIFSRSPIEVLRESLQLVRSKTLDQSLEALDVDQINLALKQIRIDNLAENAAAASSYSSSFVSEESENTGNNKNKENENSQQSSRPTKRQRQRQSREEAFRLQVMIELIQIHVSGGSEKLGGDVSTVDLEVAEIEEHLLTPMQQAIDRASSASVEDLETSNSLLKVGELSSLNNEGKIYNLFRFINFITHRNLQPYLQQLSALKATLGTQLKDLEDSKAFFSLGVSQAASDAEIKRAYHSMAIRLHPDKGGDTAKFQKLQDSYQEVLKKRREAEAEEDAVKANLADPAALSGSNRARFLVSDLGRLVGEIRRAADQCSALAQLNLQWQKRVDQATACSETRPSEAVALLIALIAAAPTDAEEDEDAANGKRMIKKKQLKKKKKQSKLSNEVRLEQCKPRLGVLSMEKVCELMQVRY